jgi:pimeloyl-ACP methyl ester carboxylesterase
VLPAVRVPTLVLRGEADGIASLSQSMQLRDGIRDAEFLAIPRAGHFSNQETPGEFNRIVVSFLSQFSAGSEDDPVQPQDR